LKINSTIVGQGLSGARWRLADSDQALLARLGQETGESELVLRCLTNRGLASSEQIRRFLAPDFPADLVAPSRLRDMVKAVDRLQRAVRSRERIMIVTDFDVDGTTSSIILSQALARIGGDGLITCYIPDRFTEGYGLSRQIVERAAAEGFGIIVTADIGIRSHSEARLAKERGIDLIICDHHLPDGEDVPADAFAVLCPKGSSGEDYPNKHLAACGVSLKLAEALLADHPRSRALLSSLAKLAAIGSIADLVDLAGTENRAIVAHGLLRLGDPTPNPGLRALLRIAGVTGSPSAYDVGFKIGPRINAAGRISHANAVLALFNAPNEAEAERLAEELDQLNSSRQQIQRNLVGSLVKEVEERTTELDRVLVFSGSESDGFHRGVVGIACSKIVDMTGRPVLTCAINEEGMAHGSARSIQGFHVVEALSSASDILVKYGGHPMAAGFTLPAAKIDELRYRLNAYARENLDDALLGPSLTADARMRAEEITYKELRSLRRLEPHGIGNPAPSFIVSASIANLKVVRDEHLKLTVGKRPSIEGFWWGGAKYQERLAGVGEVSLFCRPEIHSWNGLETPRLRVQDIAIE
jgi:single-stranded-DNA-specific exonuclease